MISTVTNDFCYEFRGLSSDTKPISSDCSNANGKSIISNGSIFLEMDTSKVFMFSITESEDGTRTGTWLELE